MLKKKLLTVSIAALLVIVPIVAVKADWTWFTTFTTQVNGYWSSYTYSTYVTTPYSISSTEINAEASTYSHFNVYQRADLGNGNVVVSAVKQVNNNVLTELPFYQGYSSVSGNNVYLYCASGSSIFGDTVSGWWYY